MGAMVATANKISKIVYTMVKTKTEYNQNLIKIDQQALLKCKLLHMQKSMAKLQAQIETYQIKPILQIAN